MVSVTEFAEAAAMVVGYIAIVDGTADRLFDVMEHIVGRARRFLRRVRLRPCSTSRRLAYDIHHADGEPARANKLHRGRRASRKREDDRGARGERSGRLTGGPLRRAPVADRQGTLPRVRRLAMSTGTRGAIGADALAEYAIACTIRIRQRGTNERTASCKVCGARLAKGKGRRALIASLEECASGQAYLCSPCSSRVEICVARFKPRTE